MEQNNRPKNTYWFKDGNFKCKNCPYTSTEVKELVHHIKSHEVSLNVMVGDGVSNNMQEVPSENSDIHCLAGKRILYRHKSSMHDKIRDYSCDNCTYTTTRKENLIRHNITMHGEISEQIGSKNLAFFKKANIHPRSKEQETAQDPLMITVPTTCPGQGIEERYSWFTDMQTKMDSFMGAEKEHDFQSDSVQQVERSKYTTEDQSCDLCGLHFAQRSSLLDHKQTVHLNVKECRSDLSKTKVNYDKYSEPNGHLHSPGFSIPDKKHLRRISDRTRRRSERAKETQEHREIRLQKMREYMANRRAKMESRATHEDIEAKRKYERERKKKQRARETPEQREARLQRYRDYNRNRATDTLKVEQSYDAQNLEKGSQDRPTSRSVQDLLEYDRKRKSAQRAMETPEQREERLQKMREYKANRRAKMTDEEFEAERKYEREKKKEQRARETPEQREARLQRYRDYNRYKATNTLKVEQLASRSVQELLEYDMKRKSAQWAMETPEQREASRKRQSTPGERRATRERVRAIRAKRTEEAKRQDRLKARERMNRMRAARRAKMMAEAPDAELEAERKLEIGKIKQEARETLEQEYRDYKVIDIVNVEHPNESKYSCSVSTFPTRIENESFDGKFCIDIKSQENEDTWDDHEECALSNDKDVKLELREDANPFQCDGASNNTIKIADKKIKEWVCDMCSYSTQVKDNLIEHVHISHWKDRVNIDEEDFNDRESLNQADLSNAEDESNLADEIILHEIISENGFNIVKEENRLQCEVKSHTTNKIIGQKVKEWVCDTCGYSTDLKDNLVKHVHVSSSLSDKGTGEFPDNAVKDIKENLNGRNEASIADPHDGERSLLVKDEMNILTPQDIMKGNMNSTLVDEIILNDALTSHSKNGLNNAKEQKTMQGEDASQAPSKITGQKVKEWVCDMCGYSTELKDNLVKHVHNIHWGDMNEAEFNDTDSLDQEDISNHDDEMMYTNEAITLPGKATPQKSKDVEPEKDLIRDLGLVDLEPWKL